LAGHAQKGAFVTNIYDEKVKHIIGDSHPIHHSAKIGQNVKVGHGVVIEKDCVVGDNVFIGHHTVLRPRTIIGNNCTIGHLTVFEGDCKIGNRTLIHAQCHITKDVLIEDDVFIAPFFCGANTARIVHGRNYELKLQGYTIRRAVRIAICVSLKPGIEIGENALIGIHSNVTKNVPPRQIWYGNPAIYQGDVPIDEIL
jgi:acetyltransferase-like isoleucine patch superfamily enzyme